MALLLSQSNRRALAYRPTQFEQGQSQTLPAPYGGLNLRDDITALKPNEARVLENWVAKNGVLSLRDGYSASATSVGSGEVDTLACFVGLTAEKLVAASGGHIYDVSSAGAASSLASGFSSNTWQTALYNNRLQFVNGVDAPQIYDGSTVSGAGWSGTALTTTNLINVACVRNRMWFCEVNQADVWYGGIGSITGTLTKFQLSQIATGGTCTAITAWSQQSVAGPNELTVFVMSTGELIIYQGDPATDFALVGKFSTGARPIGRRCVIKVGGESVIITRLGLLPVSAAFGPWDNGAGAMDLSKIDPWGKIAPAITADVKNYGSNAGWHGVLHDGLVYLSVPLVSAIASQQYVLNTHTNAWSKFTGWPSNTLAAYNNALWFGGFAADVQEVGADQDAGSAITALARCAFNFPSSTQKSNLVTALRPRINTSTGVTGRIGADTDYILAPVIGESLSIASSGGVTPWGSAWGSAWGATAVNDPTWFSVDAAGRSVSVRMQTTGTTNDVQWFATDILFKPGGIR